MSGFDNTVSVNGATFEEVSLRFKLEYDNNPNLFQLCDYVTFTGKTYRQDFQEKVNFKGVTPGAPLERQRPQIRKVSLEPQPRAARLYSDIFTEAQLRENEKANFITEIHEALTRDMNQLLFDAVDDAINTSEIPADAAIGTEVAPVAFDVDTLLNVGEKFAEEGAPNDIIVVISARQMPVLMKDERFSNFFFNNNKPLVSGVLMQTPAIGTRVYIVPSYPSQTQFVDNGFLPAFDEGTPGHRCFAMTYNGFLAGCNITPYLKTFYDDNTLSWVVDGVHQSDVVLQRPNGLIPIYAADNA